MVTPAPVRIARKSTMSSPLVKAANKIVTSPTFAKARSLDFDKKNEYEKFIKFIETSNQELLKIQLPNKEDVMKSVEGGRRGGGGLLNNFLGGVLGANLLNALRRFRPLRSLRRFLLPRRFRARLRKLRMDILRPFRKFKKFIMSIPGKIKAKLAGLTDSVVQFLKKNIDDAVTALKNLPKAKWIKNLLTKGKNFIDDGVKIGKEFLTNSKIIKSSQKIAQKASPKLASMGLGELTIIGGIVADVSAGFYRLSKGDKTGAALSFLSAIPLIGLPVAAVDIARDFNAFDDDSTFLGKLDFLDLLKTNKDNPNYIDKRTDEQKQIDEDLDAYLREEYEKDIKQQLKDIEGRKGKSFKGTRTRLEGELALLDELTSTQLRSKTKYLVKDDLKLFRKDASSHEEIKKFLDNQEKPEVITDSSSPITTIINSPQAFLLPFDSDSESIFNEQAVPSVNISTNVVDFNYGLFTNSMHDELLFLKLDK
tara:strand:- start:1575 stop:3014 length:1440 start_codon:yes stop_codon:yes gene_type:complete